jgi:hypothetical protein
VAVCADLLFANKHNTFYAGRVPEMEMYNDPSKCPQHKNEYDCNVGDACEWDLHNTVCNPLSIETITANRGARLGDINRNGSCWPQAIQPEPREDDVGVIGLSQITDMDEGPYIAFVFVFGGSSNPVAWYTKDNLLRFWESSINTGLTQWVPHQAGRNVDEEGYGMGSADVSPVYRVEPSTGQYVHPAIVQAIRDCTAEICTIRLYPEPKRRRIGNLQDSFGMSMKHGQSPGERILVSPDVPDLPHDAIEDPFLVFVYTRDHETYTARQSISSVHSATNRSSSDTNRSRSSSGSGRRRSTSGRRRSTSSGYRRSSSSGGRRRSRRRLSSGSSGSSSGRRRSGGGRWHTWFSSLIPHLPSESTAITINFFWKEEEEEGSYFEHWYIATVDFEDRQIRSERWEELDVGGTRSRIRPNVVRLIKSIMKDPANVNWEFADDEVNVTFSRGIYDRIHNA